jgi:hypothetical protein
MAHGEGNDRDAHPQRFAGGGHAAVGEGIEGDVELVVLGHHRLGVGHGAEQGDARWGLLAEARGGESAHEPVADAGGAEGGVAQDEG